MPIPTHRTIIGIAQETTKGTGVAPVDYLAIRDPQGTDDITYLEDRGMRGSMVEIYNEIAGVTTSEFTFSGDVFPETIPRPLKGLMGELATAGTTPITHSVTVLNTGDGQPPAYTITDYNGTVTRRFPGCQFQELGFSFSADGLLTYSARALGYASTTTTTPTPSFTANPPLAAWIGTLTLAGGSVTRMESADITISRPVTPIHTVDGSANPYAMWAGPLSASGRLTLVYEDDTDLTRYLTNTQPAAVIAFSTGAGASQRSITFTMTKCAFVNPTRVTRGEDHLQLEATFNANANTTDVGTSAGYGPIKVAVGNAIAGYTT